MVWRHTLQQNVLYECTLIKANKEKKQIYRLSILVDKTVGCPYETLEVSIHLMEDVLR